MEEAFKIIYKILRTLERSMDSEESSVPTAEQLGISQPRWNRIIEMLLDKGYIKGISVTKDMANNTYVTVFDPAITIDGLEFLSENALMKRAYKAAKGARDLMPF